MLTLIDLNLEELVKEGSCLADETVYTLPDKEKIIFGRSERRGELILQ